MKLLDTDKRTDDISRGPAKHSWAFLFDHTDNTRLLQIVVISSTIRNSRGMPTMCPQSWEDVGRKQDFMYHWEIVG